jgi:hypothetical protein
VEAASALKLKNSKDDAVVVDGSLLEDVVAGIGAGAMDGDSLDVGTSNEDDKEDDIYCPHLAGLSFWVQKLESNILTPSSLGPLDMSTVQRNLVSHYYSMKGDGGIVVGGGGCTCSEGNVGEEEAEEDNNGFSSLGGGKR